MNDRETLAKEWHSARESRGLPPSRLPPGDGGPYDPDMERRVTNLETATSKIQDTLNSMQVTLARIEATMATKEELKRIEVEVAEMKGRIAGLPSTAKIAGIVAIIGAAIKILPWFSHY